MEQKFGLPDIGCASDLNYAFDKVRNLLSDTCINGFSFYSRGYSESEHLKPAWNRRLPAEVERYYRKAKKSSPPTGSFSRSLPQPWREKKLLSAVDIEKIREGCKMVPVAL